MDKYMIGIIDDEETAISKIRGVIKENKPKDVEVDFKIYLLENEEGVSITKLSKDILNDIKYGEIITLIIDQKIMGNTGEIEGTEIFKNIKEKVDKFPMIMLTNVAEECIENIFVDPDKVYKKVIFLRLMKKNQKSK